MRTKHREITFHVAFCVITLILRNTNIFTLLIFSRGRQGNVYPVLSIILLMATWWSKELPRYSPKGRLNNKMLCHQYRIPITETRKYDLDIETGSWFSRNIPTMMTSSNGNIFRVTGHLCGKFTGHRWISHTKAIDVELWCFLWSVSESTVE